jgi:hypothetical protein
MPHPVAIAPLLLSMVAKAVAVLLTCTDRLAGAVAAKSGRGGSAGTIRPTLFDDWVNHKLPSGPTVMVLDWKV